MSEATFTGRKPLPTERGTTVFIRRELHKALAHEAVEQNRRLQELASDAVELYIAVKSGSLIVTPATPQEDTRE